MAQRVDIRYVSYYSAGSSALKVTPAIPLETLELPRKRKLKRITLFLDPLALAGIVLATMMMILMAVGVTRLVDARNQEAVMTAYVASLKAENEDLQARYDMGINPEEIKETALAMGMIPVEQAKQVKIQLPETADEGETNAEKNFFGFLTGLFA